MYTGFLTYIILLLGVVAPVNRTLPDASGSMDSELMPEAVLLMENGLIPEETTVLYPGDSYSGAAPLEFRFSANPPSDAFALRYEWQFSHGPDFEDVLLTRFDEETTYTFDKAGIYYIRLLCTDVEANQTYESEIFVIQVTESFLKVPNAFSPNNDGVNDVFKVKHQSLVKFNAYIFNRWGQELYKWDLSTIDEGWDGTVHGKPVKEGVYFIVIEALGADEVVYKHKGDINILR